jgi:hypothetical protein
MAATQARQFFPIRLHGPVRDIKTGTPAARLGLSIPGRAKQATQKTPQCSLGGRWIWKKAKSKGLEVGDKLFKSSSSMK